MNYVTRASKINKEKKEKRQMKWETRDWWGGLLKASVETDEMGKAEIGGEAS